MEKIEEFFNNIGLTSEQAKAVREYIIELLIDNLNLMKDEYNGEIEKVVKSLLEAKKVK